MADAATRNLDAFVETLAEVAISRPEVTEGRAKDVYVVDWRLPGTSGHPQSISSTSYIADRDLAVHPVVRFSPDLLDEYSTSYLRDAFERLLIDARPPGDGWTTYPMGDVGGGPHVLNDHERVPGLEFADFVVRLVDEYEEEFDGGP